MGVRSEKHIEHKVVETEYCLVKCDLGDGERWELAEKTKSFFNFSFAGADLEPVDDYADCEQVGPLTAEDMAKYCMFAEASARLAVKLPTSIFAGIVSDLDEQYEVMEKQKG